MNTQVKVAAIIALVAVSLLVAVVVAVQLQEPEPPVATEEISVAESLINSGREAYLAGDRSGAIGIFENALSNNPNTAEEANAKLNLGLTYLTTGQRQKGVPLLKEVSINETYPAEVRAWAANYVIRDHFITYNDDFARLTIFTGPVWEGFLSTGNVSDAITRALEYSAELHPTAYANFRLALAESAKLYEGISDNEKEQHRQQALQYLTEGESYLLEIEGAVKSGDEIRLTQTEVASSYQQKASSLRNLYLNGTYTESEKTAVAREIEESYKKAIELYETSEDTASRRGSAYPRYLLAAFWVSEDFERSEDIREILTPLYSIENSGFDRFLADRSTGDPLKPNHRELMIQLAEVDERFKDKLLLVGWQEQQFE